jgi:hypothetical protein
MTSRTAINSLENESSSDDEQVIITTKARRNGRSLNKSGVGGGGQGPQSRGAFAALKKPASGSRQATNISQTDRRVKNNPPGRIEASLRKSFTESMAPISTRSLSRGTSRSVSPPISPVYPTRLPPHPNHKTGPNEVGPKLDAIERKLEELAQENEKVALGQAVIGRQLEMLVSSLQDRGFDPFTRASSRASSLGGGGSQDYSNIGSMDLPASPHDGDGSTTGGGSAIGVDEVEFPSDDKVSGACHGGDDSKDPGHSSGGGTPGSSSSPKTMAERLFRDDLTIEVPEGAEEEEGNDGRSFLTETEPMSPASPMSEEASDESEDEGKLRAINQFRLIDKDRSGALDLEEVRM